MIHSVTERARIREALRAIFLFANISVEGLDSRIPFLDDCNFLRYQNGNIIQSADAPVHAIAVITKGNAAVCSDASPDAVLLRNLNPGDIFGAAALYCDEKGYGTVIRATADCTALLIPEKSVKKLICADSTVAENYIRFLSGRICFLNRKITAFTAGTAEGKLSAYLLSLPVSSDGTVLLRSSMSELADSLNMSRASLYRAWDSLSNNRILTRNGKSILIHDRDALGSILK